MSDEDLTWESRRGKVRESYQRKYEIEQDPTLQAELLANLAGEPMEEGTLTNPVTPGGVLSQTVRQVAPLETVTAPAWRSFATSATGTAKGSGTPRSPRASSTPAGPTSSSSAESTVWMVSPLGWLDLSSRPPIVDPSGSLMPGLPPHVQSSLQALATGRAEPLEAVVQQIAEFFVENEDERSEGPLGEALEFFVKNYGFLA